MYCFVLIVGIGPHIIISQLSQSLRFSYECGMSFVLMTIRRSISPRIPYHPTQNPGHHKGWAYIEYDNPAAQQEAITAMNRFNLAGMVSYVSIGPDAKAYSSPAKISV